MLPQIVKAFVCLGILPSLCTSFWTAPWWYDQLKGWKAIGKSVRDGLDQDKHNLQDAKEGVRIDYTIKAWF